MLFINGRKITTCSDGAERLNKSSSHRNLYRVVAERDVHEGLHDAMDDSNDVVLLSVVYFHAADDLAIPSDVIWR